MTSWRDHGSVSGNKRRKSMRSTMVSGVSKSTNHDCRLWAWGANKACESAQRRMSMSGGGDFQAWKSPPPDMDIRRWALSHALLAPHAHNLQSWLVDLDTPDTIVLRMDLRRLLPETDPWSRQLVIS